ncbi:MAG: hypothetical protein H0V83_09305 [Rubrobacter sp.]|nr:hypothetical protein [Rubrobacter sp.]
MHQREIVLYTDGRSFHAWRAKRFLKRQGYSFEVVNTGGDPELLTGLSAAIRRKVTPPFIFVDDRPLGDLGAVRNLSYSGELEHLLRGRV